MVSGVWNSGTLTNQERTHIMYQLIRLGKCVHIFDSDRKLFVKQTYANFTRAVTTKYPTTRKKILSSVEWVQCADRSCRLTSCRQKGDHWLTNLHWT